MSEERYIYSVNPSRTIVDIGGVKALRTPKSLELTKEEVLRALKVATVYRRFTKEGVNKRVTTLNLDMLHRPTLLTPEEYEKVKIKEAAEGAGTVKESTPVVEEKVVEEVKVEEPAVVAEEKIEEPASVVEEVVEETAPEEATYELSESVESEEVEDSKEEVAEETAPESIFFDGGNSSKKNKKRK